MGPGSCGRRSQGKTDIFMKRRQQQQRTRLGRQSVSQCHGASKDTLLLLLLSHAVVAVVVVVGHVVYIVYLLSGSFAKAVENLVLYYTPPAVPSLVLNDFFSFHGCPHFPGKLFWGESKVKCFTFYFFVS